MSDEPVRIEVKLVGDDFELQIMGACVQLFEATYHSATIGGPLIDGLSAEQKARIAQYLTKRFPPCSG